MPGSLVARSRLAIGLLQGSDPAVMRPKRTTRYAQWLVTVHFVDAGILEAHVTDIVAAAAVQLLLGLFLVPQVEHHTAHGHKDDRQRGAAHNARLFQHDAIPCR